MGFSQFWDRLKRVMGIGAKAAGQALEDTLRAIGPMVARFVLEQAVKKIAGSAKAAAVRASVQNTLEKAGVRLPGWVTNLSIEAEYARLAAEGKIPGKDYTPLIEAIPKLQELAARIAQR